MDFYEMVDRVAKLLQQRGRLTYRSLKRQFDLDDDTLEDLKEEILYSQPQVVDDEGKGLIWAGETETKPEPESPSQSIQPTAQAELIPPEPRTPEAERRQLTVMFVDLVGSTNLSGELDPEDYREVVRQYQQVCSEVIQRYDGHVAQLLGDGLLVYFGYPQAHEDDAQRAVRAGLGSVEAIRSLNTGLEQHKGIKLAVRLGIHTGLVVVGEMGGSGRQEQLAMGETPNVAARIQGIAQPDTVVISADTYRLVQGYFDCEPLGEHDLRGGAQPIVVYRVLRESGLQSRLDVASTRGLTPLVGRESESTFLFERWAQAKDGEGQVILLSGEAGIGKSRLVQVLKEHVAEGTHICLECRSSIYFTNSALYPIIDMLQRVLQWQQYTTSEERLEKLEQNLRPYRLPLEESIPLLAPLLSLSMPEERYAPLALSPQRQRQMTLEAIVTILLELAERQPVLFILEDLHWVDPTTLEFLDLLLDQASTSKLLVLLTSRPEFQPPWGSRTYLTQITLNRLSSAHVAQMVTGVTGGKTLPDELLNQIVDKSDGVPLVVEELTKTLLELGHLTETNGHYRLTQVSPTLAIPTTLHDSLMARLDRLSSAKGLAQLGAVIGRQFSYAMLEAISPLEASMLQQELGKLVEVELVYQHGLPPQATYTFKHALIQEAAYQSLLRSTRQQYHQRIAQALEMQFAEVVEHQPELVAHHYTEADLAVHAIPYWQRAGEHASDHSAYLEAISHFTTGIELLQTLPETPEHIQQTLTLYVALGGALQVTKGLTAPEVEHAYTQARALCQQVGETPELGPILFGLWRFYNARSQLRTTRELGESLLRLAQRAHDPALTVIAHNSLGTTWFCLGVLSAARQHLEDSVARYTPAQRRALVFRMGPDPGVFCRLYAALTLWLLGYPAQALVHLHEALALAQELSHPYSLALARCWAAYLYQWRRDVPGTHEHAEAAVALSTEQGFPLLAAWGTILRGWALAMQGQGEEGMAQVRQEIAAQWATGATLRVPYFYTLLAEVSAHLGHPKDGLQALAEAHTLVEQQEERWWEAEIYRLRGVLLLRQPETPQAEAEVWLQRALDVARRQEAKALELRAAMSLSHLWQQQGKRIEAYELLAPVYGWFTEGFDTADLKDAKALLDELA